MNRGCVIPVLLILGTLLMSWVVFDLARKLDEPAIIVPSTMPSPMERRAPAPTTAPIAP